MCADGTILTGPPVTEAEPEPDLDWRAEDAMYAGLHPERAKADADAIRIATEIERRHAERTRAERRQAPEVDAKCSPIRAANGTIVGYLYEAQ